MGISRVMLTQLQGGNRVAAIWAVLWDSKGMLGRGDEKSDNERNS